MLVTTTVGGELYLNLAVMYIYSIKQAYPQYDVKILSWDDPSNQKKILDKVGLGDCLIKWDFSKYEYARNVNPRTTFCAVRWVLYDKELLDSLSNAANVYIGDADMYIVQESPTIEQYHLDHCKNSCTCYSNILRPNTKLLTGLHFFQKDEYMKKCFEQILYWRGLLQKSPHTVAKINKEQNCCNEHTLYRIIKDSGLPIIDDTTWKRPHHGIHMSQIIRKGPEQYIKREWLKKYGEAYETDSNMQVLISMLPSTISEYYRRVYKYYKERIK